MKVLCLGDVMSPAAVNYIKDNLWRIRREKHIDLVIVNAENASFLSGIGKDAAEALLASGVDVLTGGNHTLQNRSAHSYLESGAPILRPINFPAEAPGEGYTIVEVNGYRVLVMNALGVVYMEPQVDNPYPYIERALAREAGNFDLAILDFHAEASGEKVALGQYFDGNFALIFGTHTHVPTADEQILPHGTAYITDIGCTAPTGGVLGVDSDVMIYRCRTKLPMPYKPASCTIRAEGILVDVDPSTNRANKIERFHF